MYPSSDARVVSDDHAIDVTILQEVDDSSHDISLFFNGMEAGLYRQYGNELESE